jgi:hypothetical protein
MAFSNYIVYADESGDHGLENINPENPVFVLAFCIFEKTEYVSRYCPSVQALKFEFWGHDSIVLHSRDIRKSHGDFNILLNAPVRERFLPRLSKLIEDANFILVASAVHKERHRERYRAPKNPYDIALQFALERLQMFLREKGEIAGQTHIIVERRGTIEDNSLELQFRRIADGRSFVGRMDNLEIRFVDKKHNSCGLQLADLVAYPIARHVLAPAQPNRAFDVVCPKFRRSPNGQIAGWGLKIFP